MKNASKAAKKQRLLRVRKKPTISPEKRKPAMHLYTILAMYTNRGQNIYYTHRGLGLLSLTLIESAQNLALEKSWGGCKALHVNHQSTG